MPQIRYQGHAYLLEAGETVLEGLERQGVALPSSCRAGACQSCLLRAAVGTPPLQAQAGLKDTQRAQGYFLACQCRPSGDLDIEAPAAGQVGCTARVVGKMPLNGAIVRVALQPERPLDYRAGQFVNLVREDGLSRSYSLASVPGLDPNLDVHVQRLENGRMSGWIHGSLEVGDSVQLHGPLGECFYLPGRPEQTLLLIGTGSGLAPLWGIARDALRQGHTGPIHLFHGSRHRAGLYLVDELRALAQSHANFHYTPCVSGEAAAGDIAAGRASELALAAFPNLKDTRLYLCGHPDMVKTAKKKAFLAGASLADIYADPFELAPAA
ncbi:MAG TPA: 2Fe-2S iron-sulfur cluster binding domain-containing protein [Gammaproteobacteria bacterium]|nr:2Fe-2S iron-sulfur cluster binding domain-containing protein [Gammaproteobacteria bacterium]